MADQRTLIRINLLPPELRKRKKVPFLDRTLIYVVFSLIVLIVFLVFVNFSQKNSIHDLDNRIRVTEAEIKSYQPLLAAIEEAKTLKQKIQDRIDAIQILEVERPLWVRTMEEFSEVLTPNLWYDEIKYKSNTSVIELEGASYSLTDIAQFLIRLEESAYFKAISLKGVDKKSSKSGTDSYKFGLKMTLVRDQTKAEMGEFKMVKPTKKKSKKDPKLKEVDLDPKGREELGKRKDAARKAMTEMKKN